MKSLIAFVALIVWCVVGYFLGMLEHAQHVSSGLVVLGIVYGICGYMTGFLTR